MAALHIVFSASAASRRPERELWATTPPREEDWELARRIRAGDVPEDALAVLKEQVAQKLRVSNPRALAKYE